MHAKWTHAARSHTMSNYIWIARRDALFCQMVELNNISHLLTFVTIVFVWKSIDKYKFFVIFCGFFLVLFHYIEIVQHLHEWQILNWITQFSPVSPISPISRHWLTSTLKAVGNTYVEKRNNTFAAHEHIHIRSIFSHIFTNQFINISTAHRL